MNRIFIMCGCFLLCQTVLAQKSPPATARASLMSKNGSAVLGTVEFEEVATGVQVQYRIRGLIADGRHGFHVYEKGDCSAPDARSAGNHYLPLSATGGTSADSPQKHAGDLPEIVADKAGFAEGKIIATRLTINRKNAISGRALVVHGGPDDVRAPSAPRVACGVIQMASPQIDNP